jgi:Ca-activated chloride channel family protein
MAVVSAVLSPGAGQTAPEGEMAPVALTIRRVVPEVQMVFAARDSQGRPALGLDAGEIKVLDNGVAAPLTSFLPAAGLPLRMALLMDGSESMRRGFAAERRAAGVFLRGAQRSADDQIFAMTFAAREAPGVGAVSACPMGGQTALYDSLIHASKMLASVEPARRVLLLLSDGEDNYSRATLGEAIAALQEWNVVVYSISVHSSRLEYPGDRVLRQIAAATGGQAFLLPSYTRANRAFAEVESELSGQYVVGFRPVGGLTPGEFHAVRIVARGTVIRARAGYYVGPDN